ncbi:MAG TPA: AAA family ATPase, partial [Methylomirabilota bacterium]|nr:AAA family ATPase [Methylomirabilota bacterium]
MQCRRCGRANPVGARFCQECGGRLIASCEGCGAALPTEARFCVECGRPIAPAETQGAPESYTPRHLAERILASRSAVEGERKPVTVLFCDLVGSTALAETLGAEGMHGLLSRFFETALAEVHRYEGTINQFLGDGFMALFGAPIAHEDHARRAVLAALGIRQALAARPPEATPGRPVPVQVRMGLHTGQVVVGAIGDNLRMDYTAVGDTTHLAARLQQHAEPGTIAVSEATARLVRGYVELEPLGSVPLKGLSEPVSVSRVAGPGARRSRLEGAGAGALSPFVGRDRELRALQDLAERAAAGEGQAVGIVGEPGVGKSRLLLELREILGGRGLTCLEGRCLSFGAATPYLPVLDLLRAGCGIRDADPPETMAAKVTQTLGEAGLDAAVATPYLLQLLGLKEGTGALAARTPEAIKARTFDTLRQLLVQQSRRRPLAITVEDVHWIDQTSEEYLAFLADALADAPLLLVATYRPGYRPAWLDRSFATQLALGRLAAPDSLRVVRALLHDAGADDPRTRLILDRAEGNPFFLEELARAVGEASAPGADRRVPETVQGVIAARIDRLSEPAKRVLQAASVLGREWPRRLLEAVWPGDDLDASLRELTRHEFLRDVVGADEATFAFKHALTQDVARSTLLAPRRRELHRRAAEALLALQPGRAGDLAPV